MISDEILKEQEECVSKVVCGFCGEVYRPEIVDITDKFYRYYYTCPNCGANDYYKDIYYEKDYIQPCVSN